MERAASASGLFRRLARVDELDMRVGLICERLESVPAEEALSFLDEAYRAASFGAPDAQSVFLAVGWALFDPRVQSMRAALGAHARQASLHHLADFVTPPLDEDELGMNERHVPDFGRGRPLTLGERKSLARTHDRSLIQRVVRDPHPDVIRILLDNPSLTEEDVVRVCARRPNDPNVLQTVYRHRRWVVRYRPRNAILRNPDTQLDTALLLAPLLRKQELREAATSSELAAPLRLSCKAILDLRSAAHDARGDDPQ
ncbi:MAG: hypothetical protein WBM48_08005 [Polyangiales bacterium]